MKKQFNYIDYVTNYQNSVKQKSNKKLIEEAKKSKKKDPKDDQDDNWRKTDVDLDTDSSFEQGPDEKDIKVGGNTFQSKTQQLLQLIAQKDEVLSKLKNKEISIDEYKQLIGSIPQQIITLRQDLESMSSPDQEDDNVPMDEDLTGGEQSGAGTKSPGGVSMDNDPQTPAPTEQEYIKYLEKRVKELENMIKDHMPTSDTYTPEDDRYASLARVNEISTGKMFPGNR